MPTPITPANNLTDDEKTRMLHFLGYPSWQSLAQSIALGYPAATQPLFLVYDAFLRVDNGGANNARKDLCQCEAIEAQLGDARGRMKVTGVGNIAMNRAETSQLREELQFWTKRLADDLGVCANPYSQMSYQGMSSGINARVRG